MKALKKIKDEPGLWFIIKILAVYGVWVFSKKFI